VISDFIDNNFEDALKISNRKHDVMAVQIIDEREKNLPPVGLIKVMDAESGKARWVDSNSSEIRNAYNKWWKEKEEKTKTIFKKAGVDFVSIKTDEDYVMSLTKLFKKREARY
jgi:hypothetical protein